MHKKNNKICAFFIKIKYFFKKNNKKSNKKHINKFFKIKK